MHRFRRLRERSYSMRLWALTYALIVASAALALANTLALLWLTA